MKLQNTKNLKTNGMVKHQGIVPEKAQVIAKIHSNR